MTAHPIVAYTEPFREEAEADMRRLGFNPASPEAWRRYALLLIRDRRLLSGLPSPDNDEIIEISKTVYARLMTIAGRATRLIAKLREIDEQYRAIKRPHQQDVLEHAIAALSFMADILDCFSVGPHGGLPTPLLLVLADLINVSQGRLGRLVSPDDDVVAAANEVADSSKDRARLTIQAYAAATVHRIIERKQLRSKEEAYRRVAETLDKVGFRPPGKSKSNPFSSDTVRSWYEQALKGDCPYADEYQQALKAADASAPQLLDALGAAVRPLIFERGPRKSSS